MSDGDTGELGGPHPLETDAVVLEPVVEGDGQEGDAVGEGEGSEVPAGCTTSHGAGHEDDQTEGVTEQTDWDDQRQTVEHEALTESVEEQRVLSTTN